MTVQSIIALGLEEKIFNSNYKYAIVSLSLPGLN